MKKAICFIIITICIVLSVNKKAYAASIDNFPVVFISNAYGLGEYYITAVNVNTVSITKQSSISYSINKGTGSAYYLQVGGRWGWPSLSAALEAYNTGTYSNLTGASSTTGLPLVTVKGTVTYTGNDKPDNFYGNYDDYLDTITPKWYEVMWDTLADYFQNPVPFGWFKNLIDRIFGNNNNGGTISENVNIAEPTLAPTPTPIPYTTVVIPKTDIVTGDTVYETNYYYINPSGTPIVTSSPPTNSPASGGGGGGSTEYVPVGGDPFSIPAVNWLTSATIGDANYDGIDSINEGMGSIDSIGSEYTDGMNAVQESTGTLPTSWLLLIGIAAAIPLLAGIVSRFLGG